MIRLIAIHAFKKLTTKHYKNFILLTKIYFIT
jgi:hypothetical protein